MDNMSYTSTDLTEEQRLKLQALYEAENPKPRNRAERRKQQKQNRRGGINNEYRSTEIM